MSTKCLILLRVNSEGKLSCFVPSTHSIQVRVNSTREFRATKAKCTLQAIV